MKPSTPDDLDRPASVQVVAAEDRRWSPWAAAGAAALLAGGAFLLGLQARTPAPAPVVVIPPVHHVVPPPVHTDITLPIGPPGTARRRVELAFVIDTTGSMGGLLRAARQKAWSVVDALATEQVDLRVGLVAYRDHGDEYVTRATPLTSDVDAFYQALHDLKAIGGGDAPEAVADGLRAATRELARSDRAEGDARRMIIVIGDAPPRGGDPALREAGAARRQGISVSTLLVGEDPAARTAFAAIAAAGDGSALRVRPLAQGRLAEQVVTPFDAAVAAAQRRIEATVVPWGTAAQRARTAQQQALNGTLGGEEYASRASALSKTGGFYERDLIDALDAGRVKASELRPELLPEEHARDFWSWPCYVEKLDALRAERAAARAELTDLVARRDAWLAANAGRTGLDAELLACIRRHVLAR